MRERRVPVDVRRGRLRNSVPAEPGMVFFLHMILLNSRTGLSMSLGETSIVTTRASEPVTHAPRELVVN